ncbi:hypothetical protein [Wolbachia endosymbiont (group B) of Erebia ligea]|uniref:hypothetical protein n=1 Tax=Wolbachia endosymbiont (group B) of Erebia ligea TaxID=2954010 RepID=UPI0021F8487C|nr:hypothetical protein [Wolbachia endosymbiont (group B) of Erebia ligea]
MNNSIQEKKGNPVVTLKAQAEKLDFSKLRAGKGNVGANSGEQMHLDFPRMKFIINKKDIDQAFINQLYKRHAGLIGNDGNGKKKYRQFAKEVFKEIFEYAEAQVPSDSILEELVTNCNQAGYEFIYAPFIEALNSKHKLHMDVNSSNVCRRVLIDCEKNSDSVGVRYDTSMIPIQVLGEEARVCDISFSLEFTLESQDGKDDVIYKDSKLLLTVPRKLRDYTIDDRNLFDIIKEYFYKFCEKLGFKFEVEIEHDLGDPMSYLEEVALPIHSNEHENTP